MVLSIIIVGVVGYLLGAIPFGYLVARARGVNIFEVGSRSPGATNVRRTLGAGAGTAITGAGVTGEGAGVGFGVGLGVGAGVATRGGGSPGTTGPCGRGLLVCPGGSSKPPAADAAARGETSAAPASKAGRQRRRFGCGTLPIFPGDARDFLTRFCSTRQAREGVNSG